MSEKIQTAVRGIKAIDTEIVQWENRLEYVKNEHARLTQGKEALSAEIEKKTSDYAIYLAQNDADNKKARKAITDAQEQLAKEKAEFQTILIQFQKDKALADEEKLWTGKEKEKIAAGQQNIKDFIFAVQRAISVLGL